MTLRAAGLVLTAIVRVFTGAIAANQPPVK